MLSWNDHHLVLILARSGTINAAARRLGVNETTVARRLVAVEDRVGTTLFRRVDRKLVPSTGGRGIVAAAEAMERALAEVSESAHALRGTVRISCPASVIEFLIAPRLAEFSARHPGVVLELSGYDSSASLARREADIAVWFERPGSRRLATRRLGRIRFRLVRHVAGCDEGYLAYPREYERLPEMRALASRYPGPPVARVDTLTGLRAAVLAGLGAAMLPDWVIAATPELTLVTPPLVAERPLWLVVHDHIRNRPAVRAALDWLPEAISEAVPRAEVAALAVRDPQNGAAGAGQKPVNE